MQFHAASTGGVYIDERAKTKTTMTPGAKNSHAAALELKSARYDWTRALGVGERRGLA
jgi:hypothetical protein